MNVKEKLKIIKQSTNSNSSEYLLPQCSLYLFDFLLGVIRRLLLPSWLLDNGKVISLRREGNKCKRKTEDHKIKH